MFSLLARCVAVSGLIAGSPPLGKRTFRFHKFGLVLLILPNGWVYNLLMITTDDGETFVITLGNGSLEISRDELEHLIMEGEILLHELREFYIEPDTSE